jgi:hypothetical protein
MSSESDVQVSPLVKDFTVLSNDLIQYDQLSYLVRGLLASILSHPDDRASASVLAAGGKESLEEILKALEELTSVGYLTSNTECPDMIS